jgi:transcriptional regulator with XRE-family HTH domain
MMHWGDFVRRKRLGMGYGLRRFAELVGMLPSNYNHMEKGRMSPPQSNAKLDEIAKLLGIAPGSTEYHKFMDLAVASKDKLPVDVEAYAKENKLIPVLLRTLKNRRMTKGQLGQLVRQLNEDLSTRREGTQRNGRPEGP